jgi:hypothetical protein
MSSKTTKVTVYQEFGGRLIDSAGMERRILEAVAKLKGTRK